MSLLLDAATKHQTGELSEAAQLYGAYVKKDPKNLEALSLFGLCMQDMGNYQQAEKLYSAAINYDASRFDFYQNRGITRVQLGKIADAISDFENGLRIWPDNLGCLLQAGNAYVKLAEFDKAVQFFEKALMLNPTEDGAAAGLAFTLCSRGIKAIEEKKLDLAILDLEKAYKYCPEAWEIAYNLGNAHLKSGNYSLAQQAYETAKKLNNQIVDLHCNLGITLERLGFFSEAAKSYSKALELQPRNHAASYNKSLLLLKLGQYRQGLELYEHRWETKEFARIKRDFGRPLWLGNFDLTNKSILCHAEQGLGDTIQFLWFCTKFDTEKTKVFIQCPGDLIEIAKSMKINAEFLDMNSTLPEYDFHCPLMSLPRAFRYSPESFSTREPYLFPSKGKKARFKSAYGKQGRTRIGLVIEGKDSHTHNHLRSMDATDFIDFLPKGADYFLLQKKLSYQTKKLLNQRPDVKNLSAELSNFSDTAAACANMDLIITVDTAVAHLAGALGCQTNVLLHYQSDWRWGLDSNTSHWYPSMNLIRLRRNRKWPDLYNEIIALIKTAISKKPKLV